MNMLESLVGKSNTTRLAYKKQTDVQMTDAHLKNLTRPFQWLYTSRIFKIFNTKLRSVIWSYGHRVIEFFDLLIFSTDSMRS